MSDGSDKPADKPDEKPEGTQTDAGAKPDEGAKPEDALGDAGKRALDAERANVKKIQQERDDALAALKKIEDKDKSDAQKAAEALAEAEKKATETEARANRAEVAASTGVPVDVLAGPKSSSADDIKAFADTINGYVTDASKNNAKGPVIPNQGKTPESPAQTADDWLRSSATG